MEALKSHVGEVRAATVLDLNWERWAGTAQPRLALTSGVLLPTEGHSRPLPGNLPFLGLQEGMKRALA